RTSRSQYEALAGPLLPTEPSPHQRPAVEAAEPEAEERAGCEPDRRVHDAPQRAEEGPAHGARDLARDRGDDHLERLDRDEDDRRRPAPGGDRLLEKDVVAVEPLREPDDRGPGDHEPRERPPGGG